MEQSMLQRLKESLSTRKQSLSDWLRGASPKEREIRVGPSGEEAMQHEIQMLETALQKAETNTLGLCDVCHDYVEPSRLEMDYTASVCIEHLTGKERALLESELELSAKVQQALLPHRIPEIRGLDIAAFSQPAHIVGGDYFDFLPLEGGSPAIVIADVMGKGMPASMLMASLQASLRIIAPESRQPAEVVARLNRLFCHNIRLTKFVTLFLARFDEESRILTFCNAGHNPPLLLRADGTLESLRPTGAAIGLVEQAVFVQEAVILRKGDRLLLFTDGVVESTNAAEEQFGDAGLEQVLRSSGSCTSSELIAFLKEGLLHHAGRSAPSDDTTVIAVAVTG